MIATMDSRSSTRSHEPIVVCEGVFARESGSDRTPRLEALLEFCGLSAGEFIATQCGIGVLNQSRNYAVESTWSSCLPFGKTLISWRNSASQGT
jgi:hypothetical protein